MDILSTAVTGLKAAQSMLTVTANNIANLNTPGYQTKRVNLSEVRTGGVRVNSISTIGQPVDLATESVNMIQAKTFYTANAIAFRVGNQMYGSILDIMDRRVDHHDQLLDDM